jgi:hypothetical protein
MRADRSGCCKAHMLSRPAGQMWPAVGASTESSADSLIKGRRFEAEEGREDGGGDDKQARDDDIP